MRVEELAGVSSEGERCVPRRGDKVGQIIVEGEGHHVKQIIGESKDGWLGGIVAYSDGDEGEGELGEVGLGSFGLRLGRERPARGDLVEHDLGIGLDGVLESM